MLNNVTLNIFYFFKNVNFFFLTNCFLFCCVNYDVNKNYKFSSSLEIHTYDSSRIKP